MTRTMGRGGFIASDLRVKVPGRKPHSSTGDGRGAAVMRGGHASCIMRDVPWIQAPLQGQVVYARANPDGSLVLDGGRVEVCYQPNAARLYKARASNVVVGAEAKLLPDDTVRPRVAESAIVKKADPLGGGRRR